MTRYVTDDAETAAMREGLNRMAAALRNPTPPDPEMEADPEQYRLYRLCSCADCNTTGRVLGSSVYKRCPTCRGEGRNLQLVATCGNPEAVGVALVTLAGEGEWDECPFGLMHRPAWSSSPGSWLIKPWGPSARNISDAARTLAKAPRSS